MILAADRDEAHLAEVRPLDVAGQRLEREADADRADPVEHELRHGAVDPALLSGPEEKNLLEAFLKIRETVLTHISGGDYAAVLFDLARLREPVDAFFEAVLVMAEDEKVRFNRLSLLEEISTLFHDVADFSRIVTESQG
ncbi:MAG: DALR anticodon-binding domain-containing protein [Thermodesulfobacteriota bacterium]